MPDTVMNETAAPIFRNRSAQIAAIAGALAAAQKNFAPIPKDREVTVRTKTGGSYKFKYATLDAIRMATMPALAEQQLAISQAMVERSNHGYAVETTLYHSSGEWISNITPMIVEGRNAESKPGNQELGSAQTYARRYGISALLCITADEDDDGNSADGNHIERAEDRPHKPGVPGSAGGGTDFRPDGPRRMPTSNWVDDAQRDGIVDTTRTKGTLPAKTTGGTPAAQSAVKRVEWVKASIEGFKLMQNKADLTEWWKAEAERLEVIESAMPNEYERLLAAYDAAIERTAARAA